ALQVLKVHEMIEATYWARKSLSNRQIQPNARLTELEAKVIRIEFENLDANVLDEVRKLQNMPNGRFPLNPAASFLDHGAAGPPPGSVRGVINRLQDYIAICSHEGRTEEAAQSCQAMLNVTRAINDHPTLLAQLLRTAAQERAVDSLESTLGRGGVSADR